MRITDAERVCCWAMGSDGARNFGIVGAARLVGFVRDSLAIEAKQRSIGDILVVMKLYGGGIVDFGEAQNGTSLCLPLERTFNLMLMPWILG